MVQAVIPTTVTGLQGRPILATAPTQGQGLVWNGSAWAGAGPYLPIAGGTLTGPLVIAGGSTANRVFTVHGDISGNGASTGIVGELQQRNGGPYTIGNGTWASPVSIAFPPGDWDVWGLMNFTPTVADCAQFYANVSTTPNNFGPVTVLQTGTAMGASGIYAPETVYQLSVTTSIYLNGYCWSVGSNTCQMAGTIVGRRRR